jgi:hypothetical protein
MEKQLIRPEQSRIFASILGALIVIFAGLTVMAGFPAAEQIPAFVVGIIVLIAVTVGIGLIAWHLLLRPLPANLPQVTAQPLLSARSRTIVALYLTLGTVSMALAGVWDEIWHVKYGIPFGEDFFWRPHLMLYFGLSTLIVVGGWSWWTLMTRGKGTMQQRFRANPLLGVSFIGGLFTFYAVGADPIWHKLYGADISPWSITHLLILTLIFTMGILAISYHKTFIASREWAFKFNMTGRDLLIILVLAGALLDFMLIFTIQWYSAAVGSVRQLEQLATYPDWLVAVFTTFLATLFGITALHATRQIGSATLVGLLTFGMRLGLDAGLSGVRDGTIPLWIIIPLLLSLDIWYAVSIRRTQKPPAFWTSAIVTGLVFGVVCFPIATRIFPFMNLTVVSIPGMVIASGLTTLVGAWLGQIVGGISPYGQAESAPAQTVNNAPPRWVNAVLYGAFVAFVVFFVATASPPV